MHCTCERARREARAKAFRDAADWCEATGYSTAARHFENAASEPFSAPRRNHVADCIEDDGFITAHVTDTDPSWPGEDGGLDG